MLSGLISITNFFGALENVLGPSKFQLEQKIKYIADGSRDGSIDESESRLVFETLGLTYRKGDKISDLSKDQMEKYVSSYRTILSP